MPFDAWLRPEPVVLPPDLRHNPVRRTLCRVLPVGLFWLRRRPPGVALDDVVVSMVLMAASGNTRALELIGNHLDGTPQRLDHPPPRAYPFVMPTAPPITPEQARLADLERDPAKLMGLGRPWTAALWITATKPSDDVLFRSDPEQLEEPRPAILVAAAALVRQAMLGSPVALSQLGDRLEGKPGPRQGEIEEVRRDPERQALIVDIITRMTEAKLNGPPDPDEVYESETPVRAVGVEDDANMVVDAPAESPPRPVALEGGGSMRPLHRPDWASAIHPSAVRPNGRD